MQFNPGQRKRALFWSGRFSMEKPFVYEIRVEGHLTGRWSDWFDGMAIRQEVDGETTLSGPLCDQAELLGILNKLHALNLRILSVKSTTVPEQDK